VSWASSFHFHFHFYEMKDNKEDKTILSLDTVSNILSVMQSRSRTDRSYNAHSTLKGSLEEQEFTSLKDLEKTSPFLKLTTSKKWFAFYYKMVYLLYGASKVSSGNEDEDVSAQIVCIQNFLEQGLMEETPSSGFLILLLVVIYPLILG